MPEKRVFEWSWENPEAQKNFIEYIGFDGEEKSRAQVEQIEALLGLSPCRGLDVGCGTGRQTTIFARKGYRMTGIDISPLFFGRGKSTGGGGKTCGGLSPASGFRIGGYGKVRFCDRLSPQYRLFV